MAVGLICLLSGCASLVNDDSQEVSVRLMCGPKTFTATCHLQNDKGRWTLSTPGTIRVVNDISNLEITCRSEYVPSFTVSAMPMPSLALLGNLFLGGVVGAAVDIYNNTGMKYPENIDITNPSCQ
ncbi:MAG: hypothetical protein HQ455_03315 [Burkholderiales bacterium]|nr:hypothetical protein [Burkholderiales bacterium]